MIFFGKDELPKRFGMKIKNKKCSMYRDEMWAMFREERILVSCLPMLVESMSGKERSWTGKRILGRKKHVGLKEKGNDL